MLRILSLLIFSFPFVVWAADEPTIWYEKALSSSYIKLRSPDGDRQQLSIEDPFFRRYSQAFADRYGMPQEWVVAGLEGAEAIAFRVSDHLPSFCKGNEDGDIDQIECVQPLQCELDLYLEKDTPITRIIPGQFQGLISLLPPHSPFYLYQEGHGQIAPSYPEIPYQNLGASMIYYTDGGGVSPAGIVSQYDKKRLASLGVFKFVGCDAFQSVGSSGGIELKIFAPSFDPNLDNASQQTPLYAIKIDKETSSEIIDLLQARNRNSTFLAMGYSDYVDLLGSVQVAEGSKQISENLKETSPYIWAYTSEFADVYGMPKSWVDNTLVGVQAVAFREVKVQTGLCSARQGELSCSAGHTACQMDLYLDKEANTPWIYPGQLQGFHIEGTSSQAHLVPQTLQELGSYNPSFKNLNGGSGNLRNSIFSVSSAYDKTSSTSFGTILYHDQFSLPTADVVSIRGCYAYPRTSYLKDQHSLELNFLPPPANPHAPFESISNRVDWKDDIRHQVKISNEFIRRINTLRQSD